MQKYLDKAEVLIEALPYIQRFNRRIIVVKYGGSATLALGIPFTLTRGMGAILRLISLEAFAFGRCLIGLLRGSHGVLPVTHS